MPYHNLPGLGMRGLNTDTPPQALDHTQFSDGYDMRPFDGSLQACLAFAEDNDENIAPDSPSDDESRINIYAFTHWIETGSNELRAAYLFEDSNGKYRIQVVNDITGNSAIVEGNVTSDGPDSIVSGLGPDLFAFNGVLLANTGANGGPEFFGFNDPDNPSVPTNENPGATWLGANVSAERFVPFQGRLIALNIDGEYLSKDLGNSTIVWSTTIDDVNTINGVSFAFTNSNSAGDDLLTETPGQVVDGGSLGQYLIIYKDDAVYRYTDTGEPLYLIGEPLFTDEGIYGPNCFADIGGGRHFVLGNFGAYIHDGGPNRQNVSRGRVQEALYKQIADPSSVFLFHHVNDKEVWICHRATRGGYDAHVYNYEHDHWYRRLLPDGIRGITGIQHEGEYHVYAWGSEGVMKLSSEREDNPTYLEDGNIEIHYVDFGDPSKVKHLSAAYPHVQTTVLFNVDTTDDLGSFQEPDFSDPEHRARRQTFNGDTKYKLDYRTHGRYYHFWLGSDGATNPKITGLGLDMKIGGDR